MERYSVEDIVALKRLGVSAGTVRIAVAKGHLKTCDRSRQFSDRRQLESWLTSIGVPASSVLPAPLSQ